MAPPRQGETCRKCGGPRKPGIDMVLCADHYREYMRERSAVRNHANGPEYQRIMQYRREAEALGANESEAWWMAMAAEIEYQAGNARPKWLIPFLQRELTWLRTNAPVLAKLDAVEYGPIVAVEVIAPDEGWELDEAS